MKDFFTLHVRKQQCYNISFREDPKETGHQILIDGKINQIWKKKADEVLK